MSAIRYPLNHWSSIIWFLACRQLVGVLTGYDFCNKKRHSFRGESLNTIQNDMENRLWAIADELRANSRLRASEYSTPVLGLIFLRYADYKFTQAEKELRNVTTSRKEIRKRDYQERGVFYVPEEARFQYLLNLEEEKDIGKAVNDAMEVIGVANPVLNDVLPKTYNQLEKRTLIKLFQIIEQIPMDIEGDAFGKVYEYFLGAFAMSEGQRGGEFFTPTSLVKLIVEIIQPFQGRILDPACGSGGMFVQSAEFVQHHKCNGKGQISIHGIERVSEIIRLCKMNLAVHGLAGDIRQGNSYYDDLFQCVGRFDFVMANPPFNVDKVDRDRIKDDPRFPFGMPRIDSANYLWIQLFYSALNEYGRAGFVMANSAGDISGAELEIRKQIIKSKAVDVIVNISSNFFYTATLPCMLWFFDKGKRETNRENKVLFINASHIYQQVSRVHREFTPQQIEFLANIVRLYRDEGTENQYNSGELMAEIFVDGNYIDVAGLCKVATIETIEAQRWSLNPGHYVGVAKRDIEDFDFAERLEEFNDELESLNTEAHQLKGKIAESVTMILEVAR